MISRSRHVRPRVGELGNGRAAVKGARIGRTTSSAACRPTWGPCTSQHTGQGSCAPLRVGQALHCKLSILHRLNLNRIPCLVFHPSVSVSWKVMRSYRDSAINPLRIGSGSAHWHRKNDSDSDHTVTDTDHDISHCVPSSQVELAPPRPPRPSRKVLEGTPRRPPARHCRTSWSQPF